MEITIDFETRSVVDLKKRGLFVYAEHPTTDAICLGVQVEDEEPRIWINPYFRKILWFGQYPEISTEELAGLVKQADVIVAQNSMFEYVTWNEVCTKKHGFPPLPLEKLHDTQAQLAYHALPQNLEKAAKALRLAVQKDMKGHQAMLKLCKPKSLEPLIWNEDLRLLNDEIRYCMDDCRAERLVYKTLPKLPPKEREIWLLDQRINLRGIHVDVESAKLWADAVETDKAELLAEFKTLCRNEVSGPRSYVKLKEWVNQECELDLDSIGKEATKELLENDGIPAHVKRILEIKTEAGKASAAKLVAMLNKKSKDDRVRGCFQYHGASTGRWAARGIQPQNMPGDSYGPLDYETAKTAYLRHGKDGLGLFYDLPSFVASRMVRGTLTAGDGKVFICSDFSSVESMTLNHQAGEEWVLEVFRGGECVYRHNAARSRSLALGTVVKYEDIGPNSKERKSGKIGELACGYGGSVGAVRNFDKMPGVSDQEIIDTIVKPWRDTHPMVKAFWRGLEEAAKKAIREPGRVFSFREVDFASNKAFLKMRLPSGRCLHYFNPGIKPQWVEKYDRPVDHPLDCRCEECGWTAENVCFWGMKVVKGKTTAQWAEVFTRGPKFAENEVQGLCRDILCDAMIRLEKNGFPVTFHVHDEIICEIPEKDVKNDTLKVFEQIMSEVPSYVKGLPLIAKDGWIGKRYRK